ncbi:MAG: GNAT family N-acetyltransferase [Treponema sp.]|jgi:ribosomal protein S18 acetylase RimI-like enzyme|nr:GNAT family N-acetyltransferase [Treponema sp.]
MTVYNKRREAMDVIIRLARQDDVPAIITLLIKQHGNYYANGDLYNADFVRRVIEDRSLYIVVAELADGLLAGMAGANRKTPFAGTLEWVMLTIRPSCRGFGMGKHLMSDLQHTLPAELCTSIYGHCMSLDVASQGILAGLGHHITGALLNCYLLDAHAENVSGLDLPFKHSLIVTCLPGNKKDAGPLYAPPAHAGYIKGLYDALGIAYSLQGQERAEPSRAFSVCTVMPKEDHQYCELFAEGIGLNFAKILDDILNKYGALKEQSFNVFINLNDPAAPWAYRLLEDRGFSFAGLHTLAGPYEYVILHYSPAIPVPFKQIAVLPGFAGEFGYIREQYAGRKG